jgi:DNA-binding transcriptional LysR family regulator
LRIGLMPTFTRAVLAPVLDDFVPRCPEVRLHIVEGYSGALTNMVLDDELDFAVVPAFEGTIGVKSRLFVRDREMLISGPRSGFKPLAPMRLSECKPLKIVVPGPDNIRRRNLDTYFQSHGVEIEAMLEMDAMIATLEFVARSNWVTVLPSVISINDIGRGELIVNPIVAPELHAEFVVIQPTRRTLSTQARMFLQRFEAEVAQIHARWDAAIKGTKKPKLSGPRGGRARIKFA